MRVQHIGIVGCSAEGAALCYRTICLEGEALLGKHLHPEVTMHTYPLGKYIEYITQNQWERVAELMLSSTKKVADAGADFVISPDNTIHAAFNQVIQQSPLPWIHIVDAVMNEAKQCGYRNLLVLGTRYLMEGTVYTEKLNSLKLDYVMPSAEERNQIHAIIFDELVRGICRDHSRYFFSQVIKRSKKKGCDAVVLGCTEIPLLISQEDSVLPILNSTQLLARAALKRAIGYSFTASEA